jgi:N-acetyl-1-D-myo-inositol-2-amino-2-deoxy-alpha-D-glucopyranoside deacetylase/mycothiol S-conjugate amidase
VLAPHPDDETMGPGATLVHHARQGDPIHAVFVCSGIQGDPEGLFDRAALPDLREAEARAAGAVLGVSEFTFFGYPDNLGDADYSKVFGGLPSDPEGQRRGLVNGLAQKLLDLFGAWKPEVVYYPWPGEINPDHWAVGSAVEQVRAAQPSLAAAVSFLGYEVWSPCPADVIVDVSDTFEDKLRAVAEYRTQLAYRDYVPSLSGLAAYRSLLLEAGATYGEAFTGTYRR